jgi:hypothetical protein
MTIGWFAANIEETEKFLRCVDLLERRNRFPNYGRLATSNLRSMMYSESWSHCYENQFYDFILKDWSILQYRIWTEHGHDNLSYCYLESPFDVQSYEDFCQMAYSNSADSAGDTLRDSYEEALLQSPFKNTVTPARYDYSPQDYREGLHPAAHLHVGHATHIRLGVKYLMKPLSFALFICRQFYPHQWEHFLAAPERQKWGKHAKGSLDKVDAEYFNENEELELHLE